MRYMVALIAVLLMVISALGIVAPERLVAVVVGWPPESRLCVAVGTRLVLGAVFLAGASRCRLPAPKQTDRISLPTDSAVALPEVRFLLPRCYHSGRNQDDGGESLVSRDPRFSADLGLPDVAQFAPIGFVIRSGSLTENQ